MIQIRAALKSELELGGITVFESFRGQGVARKIVEYLLHKTPPAQALYCIPFEHLAPFYQEFGFVPCSNVEQIPQEIQKKYLWCKGNYAEPTLLLVK